MPTRRGFESFVGYYGPEEDYFTHRLTPVQLRLDVWHIANRTTGGDLQHCAGASFADLRDGESHLTGPRASSYSTRLFGDAAERVVAEHAAGSSDDRLFLYVAHQAAHYPIEAPNETIAMYRELFGPKASHARARFAAAVHELDESIARMVASLEAHDLWEESLLVFLSDNGAVPGTEGGGANWPLRGGKFTAYEGGVRVPAFVHGPKYLQSRWQSARYPALVHVTDITPTLLDVAGLLGADDGFDGVSHASALFVGGDGADDDASPPTAELAAAETWWPRTEALLHADRLGYKDEDMGLWSGAFVALLPSARGEQRLYKLLFNATAVSRVACSPDSDSYASAGVCGYQYPQDYAAAAHRAAASDARAAYAAAFNATELYDLDADPFEADDLAREQPSVASELAARAASLLEDVAMPSLCVMARHRAPIPPARAPRLAREVSKNLLTAYPEPAPLVLPRVQLPRPRHGLRGRAVHLVRAPRMLRASVGLGRDPVGRARELHDRARPQVRRDPR